MSASSLLRLMRCWPDRGHRNWPKTIVTRERGTGAAWPGHPFPQRTYTQRCELPSTPGEHHVAEPKGNHAPRGQTKRHAARDRDGLLGQVSL